MGNKKKRSKLLVLLLVLAMIFTALPSALASAAADGTGTSTESTDNLNTETPATDTPTVDTSSSDTTVDTATDIQDKKSDQSDTDDDTVNDTDESESTDDSAIMTFSAANAPTTYATTDLSGTGRSVQITIQLTQADSTSPTVSNRTFSVTPSNSGYWTQPVQVSATNGSWVNSTTVTTDDTGKATFYAYGNFGYSDTASSTITVSPVQPADAKITEASLTTTVTFTRINNGDWYDPDYSYSYTASPGELDFTIAKATAVVGRTFNLTAQVYYSGTNSPVQGKAFKLYRTDNNTGNYDNSPQICYSDKNGVVTFPVQIDKTQNQVSRTFTYKILPVVSENMSPNTENNVKEATAVVTLTGSSWTSDNSYKYELSGVDGASNLLQTFYYTEPTPGGSGSTTTPYDTSLLSKSKTRTGSDTYDITLTAQAMSQDTPINREFVLVIDLSGSMNDTNSGETKSKLANLKEVLTKDGGFIDTITKDVGTTGAGTVSVAVVTYNESSQTAFEMTVMSKAAGQTNTIQKLKTTINNLNASDGTNYQLGLNQANGLFSTDTATYAPEKVMVFLSDGQPTLYNNSQGQSQGGGSFTNLDTQKATNQAIVNYKAANPTATCYSIFYSSSADATTDFNIQQKRNGTSYGTDNFLKSIARSGADNGPANVANLFNGSNSTQISEAFNQIAKKHTDMDSATISDPLSDYVLLQNPDSLENAKVELSKDGGNTWDTLTKNTNYVVTNNGIKMLDTIKSDSTEIDKIRLTIPVTVNDTAYQYFYENSGTYPSSAEGFLLNGTATFTGNVGNTTYQGTFANPNFQVESTDLSINKEDGNNNPVAGAGFKLTRLNADGTKTTCTEQESDDKGQLSITKIPAGNYVLTESTVPTNYESNIPTDGIYVKAALVADGDDYNVVLSYYSYQDGKPGETELTSEQLNDMGISKAADGSLTVVNNAKTLDLKLVKKDSASTYLAGAEFSLYENADCSGTPFATVTSDTSETGVAFSAKITSGNTYYLKETKAPAGYAADPTVYTITAYSSTSGSTVNTITGGSKVSITNATTNGTATLTATNYDQTPLPLTGGSSNQWYMIAGLVALAGGGILIFRCYVTKRTGGRI